jgi:diguanylate cyclase (GGDEF)-like protein
MMIDLDNLKRINDRQGHRAGDVALRLVAQQVQRVVRASDVCARVGGDEFAVAMPETTIERAREVAARLQSAIGQVSLSSKSPDTVEVSVGAAAWRPGQHWHALYQVADADLYEDKRRRKTARKWAAEPERPTIRLLGRSARRRVAGG